MFIDSMNREIDSDNLLLVGGDIEDSTGTSDKVDYSLVVDAPCDMKLYGCIPLASHNFAMAKMVARIGSVLFTVLSYYTIKGEHSTNEELIMIYVGYFIAVSWVLIPLYQNYSIRARETKDPMKFDEGFVCCRAIYVFGSLCLCGCLGGGGGQGPYEIIDRTSDKNSQHNTRFMPFSLYNYWFMVCNPGKMLNPVLHDDMPKFGFGRGFCYVMCTSALGNLNFYILMNALVQLGKTHVVQGNAITPTNGVSFAFAMVSALCALTSMKVTLMSAIQGLAFIPFVFGMYCGILFFDIFDMNNPKHGSCLYNIYCKFWRIAATCH